MKPAVFYFQTPTQQIDAEWSTREKHFQFSIIHYPFSNVLIPSVRKQATSL